MTTVCERIQKQTAGLQAKIDKLGGPHLTNTWKRQQEQRERDKKKDQLNTYKQVLEYLEEEAYTRDLSIFENALLTGAFYETMRVYSVRKKYEEEKEVSCSCIKYPSEGRDDWKRMQKAKIMNYIDLLLAISAFDELHRLAIIPVDPNRARLRDLVFSSRLRQGGDTQFTSEILAQQLLENVAIGCDSWVLEPEAGIGSLADEVKKITQHIDCVEINSTFREVLELKGYSVLGFSIFDMEQNPVYDAVLMNPPFSDECNHIRHAAGFLKPNGVLAAICSPQITWSDKKEYIKFREWLSQYSYRIEEVENPDFEKTNVNIVILVLEQF